MAEQPSHLNTFEKGLNKDYSIILQPDGTYRHLVNCQLISQDGNNYTIKDCLGNTKIFTINPPYFGALPGVGQLPIPLLIISFPNKIVILSTNNETDEASPTTGYGQIGVINYLPYGEGMQPVAVAGNMNDGYIPLYHSDGLHFNKRHKAEGFGYEENDLISRIYWTDNFNEPKTFNISDPIFTTYIASGSIVNGETYMVVEGAISYNLTTYAPGLGNVFTANATAVYTDLLPSGVTAKVIKYYPVELLAFNPSRALGAINFVEYGSGSVYCGNKIYFYRLTKSGVPNTSWSYASWAVHAGTQNDTDALTSPSVPYHDFVGGGTSTALLNSNKSIFMKVDNVDTNYDYIELACAEFDQSSSVPRQISIVAREAIDGNTSVTLEHTGSVNLGVLTLADVTLFPAAILKAKTIGTNKNFNILGNITERAEFDFDTSATLTMSTFHYPMNSHFGLGNSNACTVGGMIYDAPVPVLGANPGAGDVTPFSRWYVTAGIAIYNGQNYGVGSVITGVTGAGNDSIDTTTTPGTQVRACSTRNKYTPIGGTRRTTPRENAIVITGDPSAQVGFWDYKEPTIHFNNQGYWGGETYPLGILFWDPKGAPYYVKHLGDITIPKNQVDGIIREDEIGNTGDTVYSLNPRGITISGLKIPVDLYTSGKISGFSIVRGVRNAGAICQGLVTQAVDNGGGGSSTVYGDGAWIPVSLSSNPVADKVYLFLSPDLLDNSPLPGNIGVVGDVMKSASWVIPYEFQTDTYVRGAGTVAGSEQVYSKAMTFGDADDTERTGVINFWGNVDEGQDLLNFPNGGKLTNSMETAAANVGVEGSCVSIDYNLNSHSAIGGKKTVFCLETDFDHYNTTDDYTSVAANENPAKLLMNYCPGGGAPPYGDPSTILYVSTGHYQPLDTQFRTDTQSGGFYTVNDLEIFGGDCFTCLVDYGYGLWNNDYAPSAYSYAWTFPCECNSNYNLRRGRKTSNVEMYYTGTAKPQSLVYLGPSSEVRLEDFSYNPGYNAGTELVKYPALPANFINGSQFKARLRWSQQKFIGEVDDSFRQFALLDYRDLSVQNGRINNLKVYKDIVVVWQDLATNTVPILERQVISGTSGDATTIGTGGVIDRFDIISSVYGNQHQWGLTETQYGFLWFDMHIKGVVLLGFDGSGLAEPSLVLGMQGYFNEVFVEALGVNASPLKLLNSPTFLDTSDMPLMGIGIVGGYDPKFKTTYLTFKFLQQNTVGYKSMDFTISYLHNDLNKQFIGFHDWVPAGYHRHNDWLIAYNNPKTPTQYLPDSATLTNYSFALGETLRGNNSAERFNTEYICISPVTLDNIAKYPNGASGATYWTLVNATNQLWVFNQPTTLGQNTAPDYLYNKAFGKVFDNRIVFVVNPDKYEDQSFYVSNIEQICPHNVNYTDIYIDAVNQSASDLSITGTNRNYRFIRDKICSNLPFSSTGRIVNRYLQIDMRKHNWTTNPTVVATSVKILQAVKSFLTLMR